MALNTFFREENDITFKHLFKEKEALDEPNDFEILKAVQQSMKEYNAKKIISKRKKRTTKRVCYDELGCFEDSGPFSYLEMLPSHPEEINTKFYFYSAKKRSERPLFQLPWLNMTQYFSLTTTKNNVTTMESTPFAKLAFTFDDLTGFDELQIKVIVHGFGSACPHVWIYEMKTALMAVLLLSCWKNKLTHFNNHGKENCIVICVDWENGATLPNYVRAATNTRLVGKQLAVLLKYLNKYKGLDFTKTHIIGFSLGAHVAGFAGAELSGLSRITGLDPAGPLFESQHPKARLDNDDASFVDVIHSNGENLILGGLGSWQQMGHVDFYPNGGRVQTGCSNLFVGAVTDFIWSQTAEVEGRSLCNHRRAYKFFIDSVAPRCHFPAFACNNYDDFLQGKCFPCDLLEFTNSSTCGNMGYYANKSSGKGQLYLITREEEPFCAHQFKLQIFNSLNDLPLRTIGKLEATLKGEGGLNETFLISEKEDTEFFAGQEISKIIVPHPALGFPSTLILYYKSYSGWLSKGLPHWDIDKVSLTDSFGRKVSLCNSLLSLKSGIPVTLKLQPGDCKIPGLNEVKTTSSNLNAPLTEKFSEKYFTDGFEKKNFKTDILNLGANYMIEKKNVKTNDVNFYSENNFLFFPLPDQTNDINKADVQKSRSLSDSEIFEPVLKTQLEYTNDKSSTYSKTELEIQEPVLKATTPKQKQQEKETKSAEINKKTENNKFSGDQTVIVQIFPLRISELFEKVERYARETILPIISDQAPKLFRLVIEKKRNERKPRFIEENKKNFENVESVYIPHFEYNINIKSYANIWPKIVKNTQSITKVLNFKNLFVRKRSDLSDTIEIENLSPPHVDLPTYKPNMS